MDIVVIMQNLDNANIVGNVSRMPVVFSSNTNKLVIWKMFNILIKHNPKLIIEIK